MQLKKNHSPKTIRFCVDAFEDICFRFFFCKNNIDLNVRLFLFCSISSLKSRYATGATHSPANLHGGDLPPNEFASQIGHAVQEIHPVEPNHYTSETNQPYSSNHSYDVLPPGVDHEPPPPGFESEVGFTYAIYAYILKCTL